MWKALHIAENESLLWDFWYVLNYTMFLKPSILREQLEVIRGRGETSPPAMPNPEIIYKPEHVIVEISVDALWYHYGFGNRCLDQP